MTADYLEYGFLIPCGRNLSDQFFKERADCTLADEYLNCLEFTQRYKRLYKHDLLFFMYFISIHGKSVVNLDYETADKYYNMKLSYHGDCPAFRMTMMRIRLFLVYCAEKGLVGRQISLIMDRYDHLYYAHMRESMKNAEFPDFNIDDAVPAEVCDSSEMIMTLEDMFKKNGYATVAYTNYVGTVVRRFKMFADVYSLPLAYDVIYYWSRKIIEGYRSEKNTYFSIMIRFKELAATGTVDFSVNRFLKPNQTFDRIPEWSKDLAEKYVNYRTQLGYEPKTIEMDKNAIARLVTYADSVGIKSYKEMDGAFFKSFRDSDRHESYEGKNAYLTRIRGFFRYLYLHHGFDPLFHSIFLQGARVPKGIVKTADPEFIEAMKNYDEACIGNVDFRDYAMYLLAIRTGLRVADIVGLKFKHVSLKNLTIIKIQQKTKKEILTDLPVEVANALFRYVKYARPKSDSEYIFLSEKAPFLPLSSAITYDALKRMATRIEMTPPEGFHQLRKTFATELLKGGNTISDTAAALGHANEENVRKYISLDEKRMKKCALSLLDIETEVLNEKD